MSVLRLICIIILAEISAHQVWAAEFLIRFEAWAKLAQKWLVCAPLRIHVHLEPS